MKRTVIVKIFLDITMTVLYAMLMFAQNLGGFFHETVGLGVGFLFVMHVFLNRPMIKGLFLSIKKGHAKTARKLLLVSDLVLTICMPIVIITGILIAKELFVVQSGISWVLLFNIHYVLSYICLGILLVHILLHARYLLGVFQKLPSSVSGTDMKSALCRFSAEAFAAIILYSSLAILKNLSDNCMISNPSDAQNEQNSVSTVPANNSTTYTKPTSPTTAETSALEDDAASATEKTEKTSRITTVPTTPPPTLEEFLSGLRCTGCGKRCSLLQPRCGKGQMQAVQAKKEYQQTYIG